MKIARVLSVIIFLSAGKVFATPSASEDKIKSCMAAIFMSQSNFHQKNQTYAKNWSDLNLELNPDCQGLKNNFKAANKEAFIVEVEDGTQVWKIDSAKTMTKLK